MTPEEIQAEIDAAEQKLVSVSELVPREKNPRVNDDAAEALAETVQAVGWGAPPLIQKSTGMVIAGHTRLKAAARLGLERLPVRIVDVDDRRAKALALADNRIGELAEWDTPALAEDLSEFSFEELEALGFDQDYLDALGDELDDLSHEDLEQDEVPDPPKEPITRPGDVWVMGPHRLRCGDCRELEDVAADCLITDPPYGVNYVGGTKDALTIQNDETNEVGIEGMAHATDWVVDGGPVYVFAPSGPDGLGFGNRLLELGILRQRLVWVKNTLVLGRSDYHYQHEDVYYGWKPGGTHPWLADRKQTSVIEYDKPAANRKHPTMKPLGLIGYLMGNSTRKGHTVADPFLGSGTTLIAAEQMGRRCIGTEIDPAYCDVIVERWTSLTGKPATRT